MNKPKVFLAHRLPRKVEAYIEEYCECEKWEGQGRIPGPELYKRLHDKEGLIATGISVDEELLKNAPLLKVVSNASVGYDNFDLNAMKARGIIGTNTAGALDDTVADLIFALILSAARRIAELDRYVKNGSWKQEDGKALFGVDVHHSTLGIIGMGRIGEAVAKRAAMGFDMEVVYYNRNRKYATESRLGVKYSDFEELLQKSDFIVLMTPLTKATYHLIGHKEFELMKSSAIFINASRGQTVNEQALIEALENKKILGAGLDVFEQEPVNPDNPLLKMPNVVTVPHIGSATEKTRFNLSMTAAVNLVKALSGENPPNPVPELK